MIGNRKVTGSSGPGQGELVLLVLVLCMLGLLAWQILAAALGEHFAARLPDRALAWSANPTALIALAESRLRAEEMTPQDLAAADSVARRVLSRAPLEGKAIRAIALVAEKRGDEARALDLMQSAGALTLRDTGTQTWLIVRMLNKGDIDAALYRIDAMLRGQSTMRARMLRALMTVASDERAVPAVARLMATDPPWRESFIRTFAQFAENPNAIEPLFAAMTAMAVPVRETERQALMLRLIKDGRYADARAQWQAGLLVRGLEWDPAKAVFNGDFDHPTAGTPFDWVIAQGAGVDTAFEESPGRNGNPALRVEFNGGRVKVAPAAQLLTLKPGSYRLTLSAKTEGLMNERGLWWRLFCARKGGLVGKSETVRGTTNWTEMTADLTVPPECDAQWLRLELPARIDLEQAIAGVAWFDDIRVTPLDPVLHDQAAPYRKSL